VVVVVVVVVVVEVAMVVVVVEGTGPKQLIPTCNFNILVIDVKGLSSSVEDAIFAGNISRW
jgi:hypothetical protein